MVLWEQDQLQKKFTTWLNTELPNLFMNYFTSYIGPVIQIEEIQSLFIEWNRGEIGSFLLEKAIELPGMYASPRGNSPDCHRDHKQVSGFRKEEGFAVIIRSRHFLRQIKQKIIIL